MLSHRITFHMPILRTRQIIRYRATANLRRPQLLISYIVDTYCFSKLCSFLRDALYKNVYFIALCKRLFPMYMHVGDSEYWMLIAKLHHLFVSVVQFCTAVIVFSILTSAGVLGGLRMTIVTCWCANLQEPR